MKETAFKTKTKNEVFSILESHGIKRNSGSWHDYSKAKQLVFQGKIHPNYNVCIDWITKYIDV